MLYTLQYQVRKKTGIQTRIKLEGEFRARRYFGRLYVHLTDYRSPSNNLSVQMMNFEWTKPVATELIFIRMLILRKVSYGIVVKLNKADTAVFVC